MLQWSWHFNRFICSVFCAQLFSWLKCITLVLTQIPSESFLYAPRARQLAHSSDVEFVASAFVIRSHSLCRKLFIYCYSLGKWRRHSTRCLFRKSNTSKALFISVLAESLATVCDFYVPLFDCITQQQPSIGWHLFVWSNFAVCTRIFVSCYSRVNVYSANCSTNARKRTTMRFFSFIYSRRVELQIGYSNMDVSDRIMEAHHTIWKKIESTKWQLVFCFYIVSRSRSLVPPLCRMCHEMQSQFNWPN